MDKDGKIPHRPLMMAFIGFALTLSFALLLVFGLTAEVSSDGVLNTFVQTVAQRLPGRE